jgi:hypothetical protein
MRLDPALLEDLESKWSRKKRPVPVEGDHKDQIINSLSVEEIGFLKPHEETHLIGKLKVAEGILKERRFTWPIFADKESGVILDGMHRWNLLKDFCFLYMPVQHIDYISNEYVKLDVWCRYIKTVTEEAFQLAVREVGLEEVPFSIEDIKDRKEAMVISPTNRAYVISEKMAVQFEYYRLKQLEDRFGISQKVNTMMTGPGRREFRMADYKAESKIMEYISDPDTVVVFPRPLSKQDVIDVATRGEVFPPKTTRHIFQFRVFNIQVLPMDLQTFKSHEILAQHLRKTHKVKGLSYIGRGITIDRLYDEHMFRFD